MACTRIATVVPLFFMLIACGTSEEAHEEEVATETVTRDTDTREDLDGVPPAKGPEADSPIRNQSPLPASIPGWTTVQRYPAEALALQVWDASEGWSADYSKNDGGRSYYDMQVNYWIYSDSSAARAAMKREVPLRSSVTWSATMDGKPSTLLAMEGGSSTEVDLFQVRGDTLVEVVVAVAGDIARENLVADIRSFFRAGD